MKFYGTYSCGHDGEIQIYGPTKDREWKAEYEFDQAMPKMQRIRKTKTD